MNTPLPVKKAAIVFQILALLIFLASCDPLVDTISEERDCIYYENKANAVPPAADTILVMTWNIRFGCGSKILWFGDACGSRTVLLKSEITENMDRMIEEINRLRPHVLLLQEVDVECKRTAYIDQMQYIIDRTYFKYGVYATNWNAQYIPSDGIGRLDEGNSILSVWPISEATLHPLPLRNDLDGLTRYFYVREIVMSCKIEMPGNEFYAVNTHLSAFSTDDTKKRQLERYIEILDELNAKGKPLVTGGDYNLLPPVSDKLDYCNEDICPGEHFHGEGDDPQHKDGSNYAPEITWMQTLYDKYYPTLTLADYKANQSKYFTHATDPNVPWDRTLDYLFANRQWVPGSHRTYQEFRLHADHTPVSALWRLK
jgi:endonuclease/exonuclease/phosphatase family metal-dependent hydrolase